MLTLGAQQLRHLGIVEVDFLLVCFSFSGLAGEENELALFPVVHALEILAAANGPVHGIGLNAQLPLHLVQQVKGIFRLPVHFIDKGEDGNMPHGANLEQLPGLRLHAFRAVNDHDGRVRGHQGTIGILGEVLVPRGIQNVDAEAAVLELHDGRRNGNTTLLLDLHPVGGSGAGVFLTLDHARLGNGTAVKQEFLGQGGFTGVGMGDDGKGAPPGNFFDLIHSFLLLSSFRIQNPKEA